MSQKKNVLSLKISFSGVQILIVSSIYPILCFKGSIRIGIDVAFDVSLMTINQIAGAFRILNKGSLSTMDSLDAIENANSDDNETHEETTRNVGQEETSSELQHHLQTDMEYSAR